MKISVVSTPTSIALAALFAIPGVNEAAKTVYQVFLNAVGINGVLLSAIIVCIGNIILLRFRHRQRDERDILVQEQLKAANAVQDILKAHLRLADDHIRFTESRGKSTAGEPFHAHSCGEELHALMNRVIRILPRQLQKDHIAHINILMVEDDESILVYKEAIEGAFPTLGVWTTRDGNAALDTIEKNRPAMVITDLVMPGMDGFQLVRRLRDQYCTIPVLVISSYADSLEDVVAEVGGVHPRMHFLQKPFRLHTLLDTIDVMLSQHALNQDSIGISARESQA